MQDKQQFEAVKTTVTVRKWNDREYGDGEPDEVVTHESWEEADGTPITDPARIAALEAARQKKGQ